MSTEAPRNHGTGEPIPPGLKGFAAKIQRSLNKHPSPEQRQKEREEQLNAKEALRVLKNLRVAERLEYIKKTVWEGRGEIIPIGKEGPCHIGQACESIIGGLELVHYYPACRLVTETHSPDLGSARWSSSKYIPETRAIRLYVEVVRGRRNELRIFSGIYSSSGPQYWNWPQETILDVNILPNVADLDEALIEETNLRFKNNLLPAQLEEEAGQELAKAKAGHAWEKWVTVAPEHEIYAKTIKVPPSFPKSL